MHAVHTKKLTVPKLTFKYKRGQPCQHWQQQFLQQSFAL